MKRRASEWRRKNSINFNFVNPINVGRKLLMCQMPRESMLQVLVLVLLLHLCQEILSNDFTCRNGNFISAGAICDGKADCADSSDERSELCAPIICQADQFKCFYGACISRENVCNRNPDCVDSSDEFNCGRSIESCE